MQTFPLELDNALFTFNLVQYIPNWYPVKFLFINCIPFELIFWRNWFTYFFLDILQFQLFWNNDFTIKNSSSSLLPVVCRRAHVLLTFLSLLVSNTYCVVFLLCFCFFFRRVCPIMPVSLDCPFFIAPSVFSNVYFIKTKYIIQEMGRLMPFST